MTFGEALTAYESCSVIGLRKEDGHIGLNPQAGSHISADDEIVLIAEDDSAIHLSEPQAPEIDARAIRKPQSREPRPERTLILGWNDRAPTIVAELDNYVRSGSEVAVVTPDGAVSSSSFDELKPEGHVQSGRHHGPPHPGWARGLHLRSCDRTRPQTSRIPTRPTRRPWSRSCTCARSRTAAGTGSP